MVDTGSPAHNTRTDEVPIDEWDFEARAGANVGRKPGRYAKPPDVDLPEDTAPSPSPVVGPDQHEREYMRRCAAVEPGEHEAAVINALGEGRQAALTNKELAERAGLTLRQVRRAVEVLRIHRLPICSSTSNHDGPPGYWLAANGDELGACTAALKRRALRQLVVAREMQRAHAELFDGQVPLLEPAGATT